MLTGIAIVITGTLLVINVLQGSLSKAGINVTILMGLVLLHEIRKNKK